ncbi:hypothetical protein V6Z11_D06G106100 [Gossypium hirsutum]
MDISTTSHSHLETKGMRSKPFGAGGRTRMQDIGIYTNNTAGMQILNPRRRGKMMINRPPY